MVKKKSKFVAFILSVVPGLSHLYLGVADRALIFFVLFCGICVGGAAIGSLSYRFNMLAPFLLFGLAILWFIALVDAFSLIDNQARNELREDGDESTENPSANTGIGGILNLNNRRIIAVGLSLIPGAGHMYLGLLKQGAQLMAAFFLVMFITGWLQLGLLAFILPVIWFYSLFDAYHLLEEESDGLQPDESPLFDWFDNHPGWIGWGLILLGGLAILQRIVAPILEPLLNASIRNYLETGLVALILIAGGIKLLAGSKTENKKEDVQ